MILHTAIILLFAGIMNGALNAVAGGGSFISFPALLFTGVPPIPANATNTVASWMGLVASGGAYRNRLDVPRRVLLPLVTASVCGGLIGAVLLLKTPAQTFMRVLPWLMLGATLLFVFGKQIARGRPGVDHEASTAALVAATGFQLLVGVYGGYFGGGMGIVLLAMLTVVGMRDIHSMNALKTLLSATTNGLAVIAFVYAHVIFWPQAIVMTVGTVIGGYLGAHYSQKLPQIWVRGFVILTGAAMTAYFFVKAY